MTGLKPGFLLAIVLLLILLTAGGCSRVRSTEMVYHFGTPWAEAQVNGQPGFYLIDTGASVTVIDERTAQETGIARNGNGEVLATTGMIEVGRGRAARLALAGYEHEDRAVSIQSLDHFQAPGGRKRAGLIGSDFLLDYTVIFDMDEKKLGLTTAEAPTRPGMRPHRMYLQGGLPMAEVFFGDDSAPRWGLLDTGSGYASERQVYIEVSHSLGRRLIGRRLNQPPLETAEIISLAGRQEMNIYPFGPVRLLGQTFPEVRLVVHPENSPILDQRREILISGSIINQFSRVEIDYPRRLIWVDD